MKNNNNWHEIETTKSEVITEKIASIEVVNIKREKEGKNRE